MCLLVFSYDVHAQYRLIVAANRDEFHHRPTASAAWWPEAPEVVGGRDLEAGGTWLGFTTGGRFAAITNFREPGRHVETNRSRGGLVAGFLRDSGCSGDYAKEVASRGAQYNGFNLLVGDTRELWWVSNRCDSPRRVEPGVHGLSNHLLDTPWPKVKRSTEQLEKLVGRASSIAVASLFDLLEDRSRPLDHELPDTGVGRELERLLSPPYIVSPGYGTRSSTVMLVGKDGEVVFVEKSWAPDGSETGRAEFRFELDSVC
jgi:uncharacterized protein with NRDE domain